MLDIVGQRTAQRNCTFKVFSVFLNKYLNILFRSLVKYTHLLKEGDNFLLF